MNICPDCRAGKEWIESEQRETARITRVTIDYECLRCGHEQTKRVKV